ncbi:MAG: sigma-70 family RNA polymerase sigma factor [Lachnospiraceae bacterium]|nr:sigma-70 family RNA polymerase sigma factor [Lachnospiraceae bacterium]MDE7202106.1 sigma-70 family RNA polymerase sigma factor [Lachnospiraceae bacterium]
MDKEAFADVVLSSTDSLYRISKSILKNDADCEDAVQEAIATGFGKLSTLQQEAYAKTWLTRILIHECYNLLKKREKTAAILTEPEDEEYINLDYSDLYEALSTLKKEYRLTIVLYYLEGYSIEEIAKILRIPTGTVKSRLSRGRRDLRCIMEREDYEKEEDYENEL